MYPAVIIPTYNESGNIERLVNEIISLPINLLVIVVDDNSPDGTGEIVNSISLREPKVRCIHRPSKLGLGTAHIAGMRRALELKCDAIITMDADFSHRPAYIPSLIAGFDRFDVVIGSRYASGGGVRGRKISLRLVSLVANLFARLILGIKATDCTAGFRAYRNTVLESINLDLIFSNGYSFLIELLFLCQTRGWRIGEVPIIYEDRLTGKSKISRKEIYKAVYTVLRLTWRRLRGFRNRLLYRSNVTR
jgi:dolichol-phosphate mannosyltransferase